MVNSEMVNSYLKISFLEKYFFFFKFLYLQLFILMRLWGINYWEVFFWIQRRKSFSATKIPKYFSFEICRKNKTQFQSPEFISLMGCDNSQGWANINRNSEYHINGSHSNDIHRRFSIVKLNVFQAAGNAWKYPSTANYITTLKA